MGSKHQAASGKLQAASAKLPGRTTSGCRKKDLTSFKLSGINRIIKENKK